MKNRKYLDKEMVVQCIERYIEGYDSGLDPQDYCGPSEVAAMCSILELVKDLPVVSNRSDETTQMEPDGEFLEEYDKTIKIVFATLNKRSKVAFKRRNPDLFLRSLLSLAMTAEIAESDFKRSVYRRVLKCCDTLQTNGFTTKEVHNVDCKRFDKSDCSRNYDTERVR